ncbi:MAG: hypothetical protein ABH869_08510, partial [Candidatus Omnitrophota bacterium]
ITKKIEYTKKAIALNDLTETKLGLCDLYLESGQIESSENLLVEMDKDDKLKDTEKDDIKKRLERINKIKKDILLWTTTFARVQARLDKFKNTRDEINKKIAAFKKEKAETKQDSRKKAIDTEIASLNDRFETLIGPGEKRILESSYMKKEREGAAKTTEDKEKKKINERKKRWVQVAGLLEQRKANLEKNVAVARAKKSSIVFESTDRSIVLNCLLREVEIRLNKKELILAKKLLIQAEEIAQHVENNATYIARCKELLRLIRFQKGEKPEVDDLLAEYGGIIGEDSSPELNLEGYAGCVQCNRKLYSIKSKTSENEKDAKKREDQRKTNKETLDKDLAYNYANMFIFLKDLTPERIRSIQKQLPAELQKMFSFLNQLGIQTIQTWENVCETTISLWKEQNENDYKGKKTVNEKDAVDSYKLKAFFAAIKKDRDSEIFKLCVKSLKAIRFSSESEELMSFCLKKINSFLMEDINRKPENKKYWKNRIVKDENLLNSLKRPGKNTFNKDIAKQIIDLFFLTEGAFHASIANMLSRTKWQDAMFVETVGSYFLERFSSLFIEHLEKSRYDDSIIFLPNMPPSKNRILLVQQVTEFLNVMSERNVLIDSKISDSINFSFGIMNISVKRYQKAIPYLMKSLNSEYRQQAQRLLAYAYHKIGDKTGEWLVFQAMDKESPNSTLTKDAREEIGFKRTKSVFWETLRIYAKHLLWAPLWERGVFFGMPLIMAVSITSSGYPYLSFASILAILQIFFSSAFIYYHYHDQKEWSTASLISGANILLPFLLNISPMGLMTTAITMHSVINFIAIRINERKGAKIVPYGTIEISRKLEPGIRPVLAPAEKEKIAVIGITGSVRRQETTTKELLTQQFPLIKQYPHIRFVRVSDKQIFTEQAKDDEEICPYILIELEKDEEIIEAIPDAIKMAEIQAFTRVYPYLVHPYLNGDWNNCVKEIQGKTRLEIFTILRNAVPVENRIDVMESALRGYFMSRNRGISLPEPTSAESIPDVSEYESWTMEYTQAMDTCVNAGDSSQLLSMTKRLTDYLTVNPDVSLDGLLLQHRNIAAKQAMSRIQDKVYTDNTSLEQDIWMLEKYLTTKDLGKLPRIGFHGEQAGHKPEGEFWYFVVDSFGPDNMVIRPTEFLERLMGTVSFTSNYSGTNPELYLLTDQPDKNFELTTTLINDKAGKKTHIMDLRTGELLDYRIFEEEGAHNADDVPKQAIFAKITVNQQEMNAIDEWSASSGLNYYADEDKNIFIKRLLYKKTLEHFIEILEEQEKLVKERSVEPIIPQDVLVVTEAQVVLESAVLSALKESVSAVSDTEQSLQKQAVVIDARLPDIDLNVMAVSLKRLANKNLYVGIITGPENRSIPPDVEKLANSIRIDLDFNWDENMERTADSVKEKLRELDIAPKAVSICALEPEMADKGIAEYLKSPNYGGNLNFVVIGKDMLAEKEERENICRLIPALSVMNLAKGLVTKDGEGSVTLLGCTDEFWTSINLLKNIVLTRISRLNIDVEIKAYIDAIRKTAIAL